MLRALMVSAAAVCLHGATPLYQTSIDTPQNYAVVRGIATLDAATLHNNHKSLRLEAAKSGAAMVRFSPVSLTMGKSYELSGWVRSENVEVRVLDSLPFATGA